MMGLLEQWQDEIKQCNIAHGWRNEDGTPNVTFGEAMALLHSEVSEALDAYRVSGVDDQTTSGKPEGVGSEFADVLIRLLDDCDCWGIDLKSEVERKLAYNWTRSYRHG